MTVQLCAGCRFWEATQTSYGICRRYPPVPVGLTDWSGCVNRDDLPSIRAENVWPGVDADDWCGEWQAAPVSYAIAPEEGS